MDRECFKLEGLTQSEYELLCNLPDNVLAVLESHLQFSARAVANVVGDYIYEFMELDRDKLSQTLKSRLNI